MVLLVNRKNFGVRVAQWVAREVPNGNADLWERQISIET